MKKILSLAVVAVMGLSAAAENWYAGGSLGFNRDIDENTTTFEIAPEVGYNLSDNLAVGAALGYGYNYVEGAKLNAFSINPYVRYSFYKNEKVSLFCDGEVGFGFIKPDYEGAKTGMVYEFGFKPGISYAINDTFSLVAHVGFLGYKGHNDDAYYASEIGYGKSGQIGFDLNDISFGFYVNF